MEIKGSYSEKKNMDKQFSECVINEDYGPEFLPYTNLTAGKYFEQQPKDKCFAFRFSKTEEQVREEFLKSIPKDASKDFIESAKTSIKIYRAYLPVEYFTVTQYEKTTLESNKHYKTTGYTATGSVSGNTVNVDVTENREYSHTTYDYVSHSQKAKDKMYYTGLDKDLKIFKSKFYSTEDSDASKLATKDEIMNDMLLPVLGANSYYHKEYGSVKKYELHQILLFPLWRVDVVYNGYVYTNYVSDIEKSKIAFYNRSRASKEKELAELFKEKKSYEKAKMLTNVVVSVVGALFLISLLIHFFCSTTAADSDGYSGLLCRAFGGFGVFLTLLGGFSLIGYIFYIVGFSMFVSLENFDDMKNIKNSKLMEIREKLRESLPRFKLVVILSLVGLVIFSVETVFFIILL